MESATNALIAGSLRPMINDFADNTSRNSVSVWQNKRPNVVASRHSRDTGSTRSAGCEEVICAMNLRATTAEVKMRRSPALA